MHVRLQVDHDSHFPQVALTPAQQLLLPPLSSLYGNLKLADMVWGTFVHASQIPTTTLVYDIVNL